MFDKVTLKLNVDPLILGALKEDITSEDVSTNSVMPEPKLGEVELICKQDGIICGLQVFARTFELLDEDVEITFFAKDGDEVKKGQKMAVVRGDIRVLLCGERTALNYLQSLQELRQSFLIQERHHLITVYLRSMLSESEVVITTDIILQTEYSLRITI